jgi:hypothetical protein
VGRGRAEHRRLTRQHSGPTSFTETTAADPVDIGAIRCRVASGPATTLADVLRRASVPMDLLEVEIAGGWTPATSLTYGELTAAARAGADTTGTGTTGRRTDRGDPYAT